MPSKNLISYTELLKFLEEKGKSKIWFDTLRTRHNLIHKPIIKPPIEISPKKTNLRQGRDVFYLSEIKSFLEEVIDLHDNKGLTYKEVHDKMQARFRELVRLRNKEGFADKRIMPVSFYSIYRIAQIKLGEFFGWPEHSIEMNFYDQLLKARLNYGEKYQELMRRIYEFSEENGGREVELKQLREEKEMLGLKIDYCQEVILNVITTFSGLLKNKKVIMTEQDWEEASKKAEIRKG